MFCAIEHLETGIPTGFCIVVLMEYIVGKRTHVVVLTVVMLMLGVCVNANAQSSKQKQATQQQTTQQQQSASNEKASKQGQVTLVGEAAQDYMLAAQMPSQVLATSLIGMTIRNDAEQIGTIKDLIMSKDYRVVGFVVDMSGMTGLVGKSIGISRRAVKQVDPKQGVVVVKVKKSQLQDVRDFSTQAEMQQAKHEE